MTGQLLPLITDCTVQPHLGTGKWGQGRDRKSGLLGERGGERTRKRQRVGEGWSQWIVEDEREGWGSVGDGDMSGKAKARVRVQC